MGPCHKVFGTWAKWNLIWQRAEVASLPFISLAMALGATILLMIAVDSQVEVMRRFVHGGPEVLPLITPSRELCVLHQVWRPRCHGRTFVIPFSNRPTQVYPSNRAACYNTFSRGVWDLHFR